MRIGLFLLLSASLAAQIPDTLTLKYHVEALANDSMRGRQPASEGDLKTTDYIVAAYRNYGLQPKGNSFLQPFFINRMRVSGNSTVIIQNDTLKSFSDFQVFDDDHKGLRSITAVFAGTGVVDNELDAYKALDVQNKIAVVIDDEFQTEDFRKHHPFSTEQLTDQAERHGAVGVILLGRKEGTLMKNSHRGRSGEIYAHDSAPKIFVLHVPAGRDFMKKYFGITDGSQSSRALPNITVDLKTEALFTNNIIGLVEGNDPVLKNEYIIVTAHHDHLGVGKKINGDSIYNGAMDNASGVAVLLGLAEAFSKAVPTPKRSILFVSVGAEEMGLVGSRYLVEHPPVPKSAIVANVNLDIAGFASADGGCWMTLLGEEYSDMGEVFRKSAEAAGVRISTNVMPSLFSRSDSYSFAEAGIPSIFPGSGLPVTGAIRGYNRFLENYHKPGDQPGNVPISYETMRKQTMAIYGGILEIANQPGKPQWTNKLDSPNELRLRDTWGAVKMWIAQWFE